MKKKRINLRGLGIQPRVALVRHLFAPVSGGKVRPLTPEEYRTMILGIARGGLISALLSQKYDTCMPADLGKPSFADAVERTLEGCAADWNQPAPDQP